MKQRITQKGIPEEKIRIIPPWAHTEAVTFDSSGRENFRRQHNLTDKFVVMYSGNHSLCHPLDTLLGAAALLANNERIVFCFVGGGGEYQKVQRFAEQNKLKNIVCLPYQPLSQLSSSLSAADLHAVVMGNPFVGIVHPCKIYNILEIGSPVLYIGPDTSHVVDVISKLEDRAHVCAVRHGDVAATYGYILAQAAVGNRRLQRVTALTKTFSHDALLPEILEVIEYMPGQQLKSRAVVSETKEQWLS
jgi:glycosyltransferase involved in cell wall biosynthesis